MAVRTVTLEVGSYGKLNLKEEILRRVEIAARKFRDRPTQKYLEEFSSELCRITLKDVDKYLDGLEKRSERFPTMLALNAEITKVLKSKLPPEAAKPKPVLWVSLQAPGTPPVAETIFKSIRDGKTGTGAFRIARNCYSRLSDAELWDAYEEWCSGRVHELLCKKKNAEVGGK